MSLATGTQGEIASRLERLLGADAVIADPARVQKYLVDGCAPETVLLPKNAEQVAAALKVAYEENWSVVPFGGGTRQHVGRSPDGVDFVLSTERLDLVEAYDPGDLTLSVQAGATISNIKAACAQHRQLLPIETFPRSSVGGALATRSSGPLRAGFGGLRDFCIGISFVTGDGLSGRGGGHVVKNVAGYDLMKLMIGSFGTLGVITSANFKLFPLPEQTLTCVCQFETLAAAFKFRDWLLKSPLSPISAEFIGPEAAEYLKDVQPRDPDDWAPENKGTSEKRVWQIAIRFAGSDRALARSRSELGSQVVREISEQEEIDFWNRLADFEQRLMSRHHNPMIFQVEVPPAESEKALTAAHDSASEYNFVAAIVGRATLGSFIVAIIPLAIDPPAVTQFAGAASAFRGRLSKDSSALVCRCPGDAKQHFDVWGSSPTDTALMQKVKRALDPKGILNRGRFLVG
ncbi:MAG TPA: FAD-binding oxidoreductase [Terriglobales bacterium]|nr:FAD-binding oxidoreductase [Terriglobales bacterium]